MRQKVLVTGAAGYIGTHILLELQVNGWTKEELFGVDDLRTSAYSELLDNIQFFQEDVQNVELLTRILSDNEIESIIHLAGNRFARLSFSDPFTSYSENLISTLAVSESARLSKAVKNIIFSSSCAVYGSGMKVFDEDSPTTPISPYGRSKLWGEQILIDNWKAGGALPIILRYFNVVGHNPPARGDRNPNGLVGAIVHSLQSGEPIKIFGNDFDTIDGTAVRDMVSVQDIANAHTTILMSEEPMKFNGPKIYNIGSGTSISVLQFITEVEKIINRKISVKFVDRSPADPAIVKASSARFEREFGWSPSSTLQSVIASIAF
jgi:UDP-glucose 4-epimerase